MIEDQILLGAIKECETISHAEQAGRLDTWPSAAAVAYWQNVLTLRRILSAPSCV